GSKRQVVPVVIEVVEGSEIGGDELVQRVGACGEASSQQGGERGIALVAGIAEDADVGVLGEDGGAGDGQGNVEQHEGGALGRGVQVVGARQDQGDGHQVTSAMETAT